MVQTELGLAPPKQPAAPVWVSQHLFLERTNFLELDLNVAG